VKVTTTVIRRRFFIGELASGWALAQATTEKENDGSQFTVS